ncbi:MAG: SPOR domain-containing protein [Bradymonadia bacterium]
MRDFERVKEKIEVRLDTPQVALVILVAAGVLGGTFAAGYMVGKGSEPAPEMVTAVAPPPASKTESPEPPLGEVEFHFPSTLHDKGEGTPKAMAPKVRLPELVVTTDDVKRQPTPALAALKTPRPEKRVVPAKSAIPIAAVPAMEDAPAPKKSPSPSPAVKKTEPVPAVGTPKVAVVPLPPPPSASRTKASEPRKGEQKPKAVEAPAAVAALQVPPRDALPALKPPVKREGAGASENDTTSKPQSPKAESQKAETQTPDTLQARADTPKAEMPEAKQAEPKQAELKKAEPSKTAKETPKPATRTRRYTLQVKATKDRVEADAFVSDLKKSGFRPWIVLADIPGKGRYYRVRIGKFDTKDAAKIFQRRYKKKTQAADGGFITRL